MTRLQLWLIFFVRNVGIVGAGITLFIGVIGVLYFLLGQYLFPVIAFLFLVGLFTTWQVEDEIKKREKEDV
jgi:hypothetical protein